MKFDPNFWFIQPPSVLSRADLYLGYFFASLLILSLFLAIGKLWVSHRVKFNLLNRFFYLTLTIGFCGMVWYAFRYENTPIFAVRYWAGIVLLVGLIWGLFILKYIAFSFFDELKEYNHELVKSKYIPGPKAR